MGFSSNLGSHRLRTRGRVYALARALSLIGGLLFLVLGIWMARAVAIDAVETAWAAPQAQEGSPFPPRVGFVANGTDIALSEERLNRLWDERLGQPHGLDGIAIIVESCLPDPEVYLDDALGHYDMAAGPGEINDDALAWFVCFDPRYVGFFWAADNPYERSLDQEPVVDAMAEQLGDGNFTGAFVDGIEIVADQVDRARAANEAAADQSATGASVDQAPAGDAPAEDALGDDAADPADGAADRGDAGDTAGAADGETDDGGGATGLALAALGAAGIGWYALRRRQEGREPAPNPWDQLEARVAATDARLNQDSTGFARLVLAYEGLGDEAIIELHREHNQMIERLEGLERRLAASESQAMTDSAPSDEERRVLEAELADIEAYLNRLEAEADHAERLIDQAAVLAVKAHDTVASSRESYAVAAGNDLPGADRLFSLIDGLIGAAEADLTRGDRLTAGRRAEEAIHLATRVANVAARWASLNDELDAAHTWFGRLEHHAESSWADVRGNGTEAEESLDAAVAMLEQLAAADESAYGKDPAAGLAKSLDAVRQELDRASLLLQAIRERAEHLEALREDAPQRLETVRNGLMAARGYLRQPDVDPDVDSGPDVALDSVEAELNALPVVMARQAPNWPEIRERLETAQRQVEAARADAEDQDQAMESLRRQVTDAADQAKHSVSRAEKFLAAHRTDVATANAELVSKAKGELGAAQSAAREAEKVEDRQRQSLLEDARQHYDAAKATSEAALAGMSADFDRAEAARLPTARPGDGRPSVFPLPVDIRPSPFPGSWGDWGSSRSRRSTRWGSSSSSSRSRSSGSSRPSGSRSSGSGRRSSGSSSRSSGSSSRRGGGRGW